MRQLYYTFRTLLHGRGSNIIKIISLTLGLFVGILLFARVAFELSFDKGYDEPERLAIVKAEYHISGQPDVMPSDIIIGPVAPTIMEEFPAEVEAATVTCTFGNNMYRLGDKEFTPFTVVADTLFFRTMGIRITSGKANELAAPDMMFISDELARQIFGTTDVIGKTLMRDGVQEFTIRGTFLRLAENNSMRPEVVLSMASLFKYGWRNYSWGGGDSFKGFVRLKEKANTKTINDRIDDVVEKYAPFNPEENGFGMKFHLENINKAHTDNPDVRRVVMLLSLLAVAILLIAAMNYVLIAISSLARRAKSVGVHKVNGSTGGQIFGMFLWETGLIILISLLLVGLLIINLRGLVEELIEVRLGALFTLQTLWVPALVVLFVFIIAGVIPGRMFARIPVTQVFRRYTERNSRWKQVLLFAQFAGVAFVFGVLAVIYGQYRQIMNFDLGYQTKNIATAYVRGNKDVARSIIESQPAVEDFSYSWLGVGEGYTGQGVKDNGGRMLFSTRMNSIDENFVGLYGIRILEGRNIQTKDEVLVNKIYVSMMPWTEGALGMPNSSETPGIVVGIIDDIVDNSLFTEKQPLLLGMVPEWNGLANVKLREPFAENLELLNQKMVEAFPTSSIVFHSVEQRIENKYASTRRFRDSAGIAFAAILLITLMGLIGYINDEIQRRSKEIAVRKVNGAEEWNIISLLGREVAWMAIPSVMLGALASYFVSLELLAQFQGTQLELGLPMYIGLCITIVAIIIGCVIIKAWKIANENPVISIKNE